MSVVWLLAWPSQSETFRRSRVDCSVLSAHECELQHRPIANAEARRRIRCVEERALLLCTEMPDDAGVHLLRGNGPYSPHLVEHRGHPMLDELHEGPDGGQSGIARARRVAAFLLEMVEELEHQRRVELLELDIRGRHAKLLAH